MKCTAKTMLRQLVSVILAKSFRGKTAEEPRPNWNPLILPISELCKYSDKIDTSYVSHVLPVFVKDESMPNTIREVRDGVTVRYKHHGTIP